MPTFAVNAWFLVVTVLFVVLIAEWLLNLGRD